MAINRHEVTYTSINSYETLNELTTDTKNVWIVFHGMGFLSRYFLKHFRFLNVNENYIICPQAPSKYYLKDDFKHVGASWLTKEDTSQETKNVLNYIDAVLFTANIPKDVNIILFGFSQGVSIAMRWLVSRKFNCDKLVLYAGGIPNEIEPKDIFFLSQTEVKIIYGDSDKYLTPKRLAIENKKIKLLFGKKADVINFNGGHEIKQELFEKIMT
ncbi:alpha/beta hydrolase [Croceitalea rosinachiae]|uniref:Esterase n=1 Tax=Croceitalea rosinachiae TaxID=3075596 RepID=A0ABU3AAZ3_9FLAO|nr:esterase [Croceitalea sp. F388]MDT0607356.1 esterase [Croceitalea sp. F388]